MEEPTARHYTLHSEQECDRLEKQAILAGIGDHLRYMRIPDRACILDAGCGSGSMSRLLAARHPDATVVGVDLNPQYVGYARALAERARIANVSFQVGDVQALPFANATFDLIWSKYVLFFLPRPEQAVAEFLRTTKPAGTVVIALDYWPGLVLDPDDEELHRTLEVVFRGLADISLPSRLPTMLMRAGFVDVSVQIEASRPYTIVGSIDPQRRWSHATEANAVRPYVARILGSETACDKFYAEWFGYLDRSDTCTVVPIWFVEGTVPREQA